MAGQPNGPQTPPTGSAGYLPPPPPQTSWPKTLGILMIVFGALGIPSNTMGLFARRLMEFAMKQAGHADVMQSELMQRWMQLTTAFSGIFMVLAVLLLTSGIGLLNRRVWAVKASTAWAGLKIILEVASMLGNWTMQKKLVEAVNAGAIDAEAVKGFVSGQSSLVAMLPGLLLSCALPVFVLIWLSLPNTKEETAAWA